MLKHISKFVAVLLLLLPLAMAQQTRVYGDGGNWTQEITGSLAAVKNLRVKVDVGSVRVNGGGPQGINYEVRITPTVHQRTRRAGTSTTTKSALTSAATPPGS